MVEQPDQDLNQSKESQNLRTGSNNKHPLILLFWSMLHVTFKYQSFSFTSMDFLNI
jgi:hypothetical protein